MKTLIKSALLILLVMSLTGCGDDVSSELPPCSSVQYHHNCFGTVHHGRGGDVRIKYVGELKNGTRHGKGSMYYKHGTVKSGIWEDGKYLYDLAEHKKREKREKQKREAQSRRQENDVRARCARDAGKAGTEYAAKQIEKTCLAEKGLEPES